MTHNSNTLFKAGGGTVQLGIEQEAQSTLPAGAYSAYANMMGRFIRTFNMNTDKLLYIKSKPMEDIKQDISAFLTPEKRERFKDFNIMYRRNYMMHGPPGTGKSALVNLLAENFVKEHNGLVIRSFRPDEINEFIAHLRSVDQRSGLPERPVMLVVEEFDSRLESDEFAYTNLLDGEYSFPNSILLATTNHFDRIPSRIKNRPSRFSMIREIGYPDREARFSFLNNMVPEKYKAMIDIETVAEKTTNVSIDHLKDVVISICCFDQTYDDAVAKIREMQGNDKNDDD